MPAKRRMRWLTGVLVVVLAGCTQSDGGADPEAGSAGYWAPGALDVGLRDHHSEFGNLLFVGLPDAGRTEDDYVEVMWNPGSKGDFDEQRQRATNEPGSHEISLRGTEGVVGTADGETVVVWYENDSVVFRVEGIGLTEAEMIQIAESIEQVSWPPAELKS